MGVFMVMFSHFQVLCGSFTIVCEKGHNTRGSKKYSLSFFIRSCRVRSWNLCFPPHTQLLFLQILLHFSQSEASGRERMEKKGGEEREKGMCGEGTEGRRQEGQWRRERNWGRRRTQRLEKLDHRHLNGQPLFCLRMDFPRSHSDGLSWMPQTSGEETQAWRHLTPPFSWNFPAPSHPAGVGRALDRELPLKGTSLPCHIYKVTDARAPEKESGNEILTT